MKYVIKARNGQVLNWNLSLEEAENLKARYEASHPEDNFTIEEQDW